MARGPKKHLKRLAAPKSWMLDKLGGVFAPRPSTGPHKLRESLPMVIFLRNRLKYALNKSEVMKIVMQRHIKVDGKVRTDPNYPAGFMGEYGATFTASSWACISNKCLHFPFRCHLHRKDR
jgi:small subunit ribosomal protein S4e